MLKNFVKNRKAQNTAEYALLIALVVAGIIAMQTYAQRALQARIHGAAQYMANAGNDQTVEGFDHSSQYEPYYLNSNYHQNRESGEAKILGQGLAGQQSYSKGSRKGSESSTYCATTSPKE